jgi:hypothetical protein
MDVEDERRQRSAQVLDFRARGHVIAHGCAISAIVSARPYDSSFRLVQRLGADCAGRARCLAEPDARPRIRARRRRRQLVGGSPLRCPPRTTTRSTCTNGQLLLARSSCPPSAMRDGCIAHQAVAGAGGFDGHRIVGEQGAETDAHSAPRRWRRSSRQRVATAAVWLSTSLVGVFGATASAVACAVSEVSSYPWAVQTLGEGARSAGAHRTPTAQWGCSRRCRGTAADDLGQRRRSFSLSDGRRGRGRLGMG